MIDSGTTKILFEQLGPVAATIIFVAFLWLKNPAKPEKTTIIPPGFSDAQKLYLRENVVDPILNAIAKE